MQYRTLPEKRFRRLRKPAALKKFRKYRRAHDRQQPRDHERKAAHSALRFAQFHRFGRADRMGGRADGQPARNRLPDAA